MSVKEEASKAPAKEKAAGESGAKVNSVAVGELASVCFADIESGLMVLDKSGRIIMWNAWMSKASRVASKNAVGRELPEVFPTIAETRVWKSIQSALKHGMPALLSHTLNKAQFPLYRPFRHSEELMRQIIVIKPTRIPGVERHCLVQISDVTPAVVREEMLRKQAHELKLAQQMLLEAERKEAERAIALERESTEAAMAGGFAHEMRNALSGGNLLLMGSLGLESKEAGSSIPQKTRETLVAIHKQVSEWGISKEQLTELGEALRSINKNEKNIEHVLNSVHGATERALMITKQIMQYSKMGHSLKGMERVSVSELIAAVMDDSEVDFGSGHVDLLIEVPDDLVVQGDNLQYYSIIKNLVQNARDAVFERFGGDEGGRVGLIIESHEAFWRVVVSDNGVGIPEEHRPQIFKAFFSTKPETGTGLGLGMVKKLVNLYNGTINVDSVVGEGTTFTLDFQLLPEKEDESAEQSEGASLGDAKESVDG